MVIQLKGSSIILSQPQTSQSWLETIKTISINIEFISSTLDIGLGLVWTNSKSAKDNANLYVKLYGTTAHKVLKHGALLMRHHVFPLGELSE